MTYGNSDSITEEEMKIYDYFLASDQLEGRNLPSRGYDTAALYIASQSCRMETETGWAARPARMVRCNHISMPFELISRSRSIRKIARLPITGGGGGGRGAGRGAAAGAVVVARAAELVVAARVTDFEYGKDWTAAAGGRGAPPVHALRRERRQHGVRRQRICDERAARILTLAWT